jgi:hypothetical protein
MSDQCQGKTIYKTAAKAKEEAKTVSALYNRPMKYYACGLCGFWHLTSVIKDRKEED